MFVSSAMAHVWRDRLPPVVPPADRTSRAVAAAVAVGVGGVDGAGQAGGGDLAQGGLEVGDDHTMAGGDDPHRRRPPARGWPAPTRGRWSRLPPRGTYQNCPSLTLVSSSPSVESGTTDRCSDGRCARRTAAGRVGERLVDGLDRPVAVDLDAGRADEADGGRRRRGQHHLRRQPLVRHDPGDGDLREAAVALPGELGDVTALAPNSRAEVALRTIARGRKRPTSAPYSSVADAGSTAAEPIGYCPLMGAST